MDNSVYFLIIFNTMLVSSNASLRISTGWKFYAYIILDLPSRAGRRSHLAELGNNF